MIKEGLGFRFAESLERAYNELSKGAVFFRYIDTGKRYRRILLDRFPMMVIYEIERSKVIVVAIKFEREGPLKRKRFAE